MDGTLIDSEPYWMLSETRLAKQYGSTWTEKDALQLIGNDLFHASDLLRNKFGIEDMTTREVIDRLTEEVIEQLRTKLPWRPGALELLVELKKAGIKTALVTMSMRTMALTVADQIDFQAFDVVVAGDDVTNGKPHPEPYLRAAELLGVAPEDCLAFRRFSDRPILCRGCRLSCNRNNQHHQSANRTQQENHCLVDRGDHREPIRFENRQ